MTYNLQSIGMSKNIEQLYSLKTLAVEHLTAKKYVESAVYFRDILAKFESSLTEITTEADMEKAIR